MKNNLKSLVEGLLSENQDVIGISNGVQSLPTVFTQREVPELEKEPVEEKTGEEFVVEVDGKIVWEGIAKDSKEAIKKAGDENEEALEGKVRAYKKTKVNEEEIVLSPKSFRTLYNCFIAEQMVNEAVDIDETLGNHGLITEGKITEKGRLELKKYLPTLFSS
jgi:hypothetical protein